MHAVMIVVDPERGAVALLDDVATALVGAGYADPFTTTPGMRLRCLWASGRLEAVGARPDRSATTVNFDELSGLIVVALVVTMLLEHNPSQQASVLVEAREALHAALLELS